MKLLPKHKILRKPTEQSPKPMSSALDRTKAAKFVEIAGPRVNKILKYLDLLGNCASRGAYESTPNQRNKIFTAIRKKVDETEMRFNHESKDIDSQFKFE